MIAAEAPVKLTKNEGLKEANPLLDGTIPQTLADPSAECFSHDDYEFLKFHGIYQQDDRDSRKEGKHYIMMVRTKFPGGVLSAPQYVACDQLADQYGNHTLRITTRQDFQFHGIVKANLRQTMKSLNEAIVSTIGACGDLERNVMAPPTPATSPLVDDVLEEARKLSNELCPKTFRRDFIEWPFGRLQSFGRRRHGHVARQRPHFPQAGRCDRVSHSRAFDSVCQGGHYHSSRLR